MQWLQMRGGALVSFLPFGPNDVLRVPATAFAAIMWDWNQDQIISRLQHNHHLSVAIAIMHFSWLLSDASCGFFNERHRWHQSSTTWHSSWCYRISHFFLKSTVHRDISRPAWKTYNKCLLFIIQVMTTPCCMGLSLIVCSRRPIPSDKSVSKHMGKRLQQASCVACYN